MSDISKMEVKPCPMCGGKMEFDGIGGYQHAHKTLEQADCVLYDRYLLFDEVESWNRRAPPPELEDAWERLKDAQMEYATDKCDTFDHINTVENKLFRVVKKLCEGNK